MNIISKWLNRLGCFLQGNQFVNDGEQNGLAQKNPQMKNPIDNAEFVKSKVSDNKPKIENYDNLLYSIISTLDKLVKDKEYTRGKSLIIWLNTDQTTFDNIASEQYKQRLLIALVNERSYCFEDVNFTIGSPSAELHAACIGNNELEHLQVIEKTPTPTCVSCKAIITIFGGAGSLIEEKYELSLDDMKNRKINAYNIGAGQFPKVPTCYRENHIAIDDNLNSPQFDKNKFVSRMHAHIGFSDNFGFYLQVEMDGTRLMGKRTRIFRGEEKIECDNPQAKIPLQDGDLIELGKAVRLKYELLNNN